MPDQRPEKARIAAMLSGNGTTMSALLYASRLPNCPYEIVLVASNRPDAPGLRIAEAEGIPVFAHNHKGMGREEHEAVMDAALREAGADYVALCGYMRLLTPSFVASWEGRMFNTHPSLLPRFRGLDTHQRALEAGESHGGCTVHLVTAELDDGPILGQIAVPIIPGESAETLSARVLLAEYQLYPHIVAEYVSRPFSAQWLVQRVRELALALPEAEERDSHGAPGWRTGGKSGKFFAYFSDRHHGSSQIGLLVKTDGPDELAALVERDPETYFRPAYYGASGWVGIALNRPGVDWEQIADWLQRSWRAVAPKRLTGLIDAAEEF